MNTLRAMFLICVWLLVSGTTGMCATIGDAKTMPEAGAVIVAGSITFLEPTECYIESTDRTSGIWVQAATSGFAIGDLTSVTGTLGTVDGERVIQSATLAALGSHYIVAPFAMRGNWVGGFCQSGGASLQDWTRYRIQQITGWRWQVTGGASNTGLLSKIWGTVTAVCYSPVTAAHWFHIDDGSGVICDYGDSGVIVYSDANVSEGDFVTVTGVSSVETSMDDTTRLVRVIRPRSVDDVQAVGGQP